jgi:hypothetical protein
MVFISLPPSFNVAPKIRQQSLSAAEVVRILNILHVPMVALTRLIIVTQHANSIDYERQPILVPVLRACRRPRQLPNDDLDESSDIQDVPFVYQQVASCRKNSNMRYVMSKPPTACHQELSLDMAGR